MFDVTDEGIPPKIVASISFTVIRGATELVMTYSDANEVTEIEPGRMVTLELSKLVDAEGGGIEHGDELQQAFEFTLDDVVIDDKPLLSVEVARDSVNQTNAAAAQQLSDSVANKINTPMIPSDSLTAQCRKFAWSPEPQRIELVNGEDLKGDVVRRRAVFQWFDTVRAAHANEHGQFDWSYALQKVMPSGATHFPWLGLSTPQSDS